MDDQTSSQLSYLNSLVSATARKYPDLNDDIINKVSTEAEHLTKDQTSVIIDYVKLVLTEQRVGWKHNDLLI